VTEHPTNRSLRSRFAGNPGDTLQHSHHSKAPAVPHDVRGLRTSGVAVRSHA